MRMTPGHLELTKTPVLRMGENGGTEDASKIGMGRRTQFSV